MAPATEPSSAQAPSSSARDGVFGTYLRPYAANSLWNSRPLNPVFGTWEIPKSSYFPTVASGAYSTGVFLAAATDSPMTVVGTGSTETNTVGVADPDSGTKRVITLPRWPATVLPASGSDGHADIVDPVTNIVHSFWQLKQQNGRWTAAMYSWSKLGGTGWGDPSHYYQGARAVGIPASAGLIRKHEIKDGLAAYPHALAMSLTFNALADGVSNPAYVFPATAADNSASANTGTIPQGSLLMLPPNFDSSAIVNPDLKKIVETLKLYGAYVVDRNTGTPFVIYVENDAGFNLMPKGWDNSIADQLDKIRASLRQVTSAQAWVDGNGDIRAARSATQQSMNILSMRGGWYRQSGTGTGDYDPIAQNFSFAATTTSTVYVNANNTGLTPVKWARPEAGTYVNFTVRATGGARLRLQVKSGNTFTHDTWDLVDGKSVRILWPANASMVLIATSGTNGPSTVKAELVPST
ncbi:Atrophin-1 multi-domain protein [Massilia aurea]|uniref:Atrophin-1 multi-domain protein n=1 Tax=Massilia aurea TaxID=373040 RepID=UPI002163C364|nr:Atrophin-1 multi-domain protein [Massilia aurea]